MTFDGPPEDYAPLEPVTTCDPTPKPGAVAFRDWTLANWGGRSGGIWRDCDNGPTSKHHEGRAWDWHPPDQDTGDQLIEALMMADESGEPEELARRAGLRTIIWWGRIWIAGRGWAPYSKSAHRDHVHFGFGWAGARAETSFFEVGEGVARVAPFCPGLSAGAAGVVVDPKTDVSNHAADDAPSNPDIYEAIDDEH